MLAMALLMQPGRGAMSMPSHADDNATVSYWRWRCPGNLAVAQCRCQAMLVAMLPSHTGDGAAKVTWP
jgi:hypothetical protein